MFRMKGPTHLLGASEWLFGALSLAGFWNKKLGVHTEITEGSFHLRYTIKVLGSILTTQEAMKRFGADGGSIINLSSIVGSHPVAGALPYSSTKGTIETLAKGLALGLVPRKIRVNAIARGHTETEGNIAAGTFEAGAGAALVDKTPLGRLSRVTESPH